jgi:hypothetical protein
MDDLESITYTTVDTFSCQTKVPFTDFYPIIKLELRLSRRCMEMRLRRLCGPKDAPSTPAAERLLVHGRTEDTPEK